MTALDLTPCRPVPAAPSLPTLDLEPLKAWIADWLGLPEVLPGDWYL